MGPEIRMVHKAADKKAAVYVPRFFMSITMKDETACSQVSLEMRPPEANHYEFSIMNYGFDLFKEV